MCDSLCYLVIDVMKHVNIPPHTHTIILNISFPKEVATILYFCFLAPQNEKIHSSQPSEYNLF